MMSLFDAIVDKHKLQYDFGFTNVMAVYKDLVGKSNLLFVMNLARYVQPEPPVISCSQLVLLPQHGDDDDDGDVDGDDDNDGDDGDDGNDGEDDSGEGNASTSLLGELREIMLDDKDDQGNFL